MADDTRLIAQATINEPTKIDLARAVTDLEKAAQHLTSREALEEAAAVAAAAIAAAFPLDTCASPRRAGISEEHFATVRAALVEGRPNWTGRNIDDELWGYTVQYTIGIVFDGEGRPRPVLAREADGFDTSPSEMHWWLFEPLADGDDERAFASPQDPTWEFHEPTLDVLLAFAKEVRPLIPELVADARDDAEQLVERVQELEQLAARCA